MRLNADISEIPWKKVSIVAAILLVVGAAIAGLTVFQNNTKTPATPEKSYDVLQRYLKQRAERSEFNPSLDAANEKTPWNTLKAQYNQPPDYKTVYRTIGEHLVIAEHLLNQESPQKQAEGMRIVSGLCSTALDVAVDPWLAARICDAYIVPHFSKIDEKPKYGLTREHFMDVAGRVYRAAEEIDRYVQLSRTFLSMAKTDQKIDQARYRLGRALEDNGQKQEALKYFQEITHPSLTNNASRRIASIERSLNR